jgi:hypothetical protein
MKLEEILEMKPGIELNIKVAEKVMGNIVVNDKILGYVERKNGPQTEDDNPTSCRTCCGSKGGGPVWGPVEGYSEGISSAMLVVSRMIDSGYQDAINWNNFGGGKYTEAEAICKAALLAVLEKEKLIETSDEILRQALPEEE